MGLHDVMAGYVERGEVAGVVTLVDHRGRVEVDAVGALELGGDVPMARDTVFRISSMTKPVAAVAALLLVEEGRLGLDDPVDDLLPELADRRVVTRPDAPVDATGPAHRPVSLRDLLTLRLGFGFVLAPGPHPAFDAAVAAGVAPGPPDPARPLPPDEWLRRFGTLPLLQQPGTAWMYDTAFSVLGVLLARAAGRPLPEVLHERIFGPLGMTDTGFVVPDAAADRLAAAYVPAPGTDGGLVLLDDPAGSAWRRAPAFPDAANGLVSTVDDYLAFARTLLRPGALLAPATVELMTTDQLTGDQRTAAAPFLDGRGWGLGVSVGVEPGRFGWDGGLGSSWSVDPARDLTAVLMTQRMDTPEPFGLRADFWSAVHRAVDG
jgi:CubicO group peptidase (beta-lactamase class C family)